MADGATPFSPVKELQASEKAVKDLSSKETKVAQQGAAQLGQSEADTRSAFEAIEKQGEGLHPPTMNLPQQPQVQETSAVKQWSSAAMIFAAIGSLFTRRPLTTAINAASTALDAFRKNDIANATGALNVWKTNMDYAMKLGEFENDQYKTALGDDRNREQMVLDLGSREQQNIVATVQSLAKAFGDESMAAQRNASDMVRLIEARENRMTAMQMSGGKIAESFAFIQKYNQWTKDFQHSNGRAPNGDEIATEVGHIRQEIGHQWNEQEVSSEVDRTDKSWGTAEQGKDYNSAFQHGNIILNYNPDAKITVQSIIPQVAQMEQFVQSMNGNRAMRSFQLTLLQKDMGLINNIKIALQQIGGSGLVTPELLEKMHEVAKDVMHLETVYGGQWITGTQFQKAQLGLEPSQFMPPGFDLNNDPQKDREPGWSQEPPPEAVDKMKQHIHEREYWLQFDAAFGPGRAAEAVSDMFNAGQ